MFTNPEVRDEISVERSRFLTSELYQELNNRIKGKTIVALGSSTDEFIKLKEENPARLCEFSDGSWEEP
jgi:hypothetical protein